MGGGFYDRTLHLWRRGGPYPIGLSHDCQQVAQLPTAHWDIPLPEILTPTRSWAWPGRENSKRPDKPSLYIIALPISEQQTGSDSAFDSLHAS